MDVRSYREFFQAHLEDMIRMGGEVGQVVSLVNAYQGSDPTARHFAFREWLEEASVVCGQCGASFTPPAEEVEEDDPIRCRWCARSLRDVGAEPVPGWRRTWVR